MGKVLVIEDSEEISFALLNLIKKEGHNGFAASTGAEALEVLGGRIIDLVFLDIGLPDISGLDLISKIKDISPDAEIVMLTGRDDARSAVFALKSGVADYIVKPFEILEFKNVLNRTLRGRLSMKHSLLEKEQAGIESLVGESDGMHRLKEAVRIASGVSAPVLITGETGTGKELVARAIHGLGGNKNGVFVKVDCGTLSANIIESELFGHEKGSFTDARADKKGLVETADGGTLFLDEIGNLPLELQPKLLRLVEESTFRKVGGLKDIRVDLRLISATNLDLRQEANKGTFREDLFYRLNVISVAVPPLRERGNDIIAVAYYFLRKFGGEMRKNIRGFSPDAEKLILSHNWPGNVRELKNRIERALIYAKGDWLTPSELDLGQQTKTNSENETELTTLKEMELKYIKKVLTHAKGNRTLASKILGISRTTLRDKLDNS